MDKIIISELEFIANHGVFKEEKFLGQKFCVSVEMITNTREAGKNDDLNFSTHYGLVANDIEKIFSNNSFDLIETCAEKIAEMILLKYPLILEVKVLIKKPWAPLKKHFKFVGVEITRKWHKVFLSIGSNIGDKKNNLLEAIDNINELKDTSIIKQSNFLETEPFGLKNQDNFINACLELKTLLSPQEMLTELLNIEKKMGRIRLVKWGPRIIDLDILLFDNYIIEDDNLSIPHPYMCERMFVLEPLVEIAPHIIHPLEQKTILSLKKILEKELSNDTTL